MISYRHQHRALGRILLAAFLLSLCVSVYAHTGLKTSSPGADAVVNAAPEQIQLDFTAAVSLVRFSLTAGEERQVPVDFKPRPQPAAQFSVPIPPLPAGHYKVAWAVIGADGHTVSDTFGFTIDPAAGPASGAEASQAHAH